MAFLKQPKRKYQTKYTLLKLEINCLTIKNIIRTDKEKLVSKQVFIA